MCVKVRTHDGNKFLEYTPISVFQRRHACGCCCVGGVVHVPPRTTKEAQYFCTIKDL